MERDQILDLFNLGETAEEKVEKMNGKVGDDEGAVDAEGNLKKKGEKGWLDDIGELWDEKQYEEEFNLDSFMQNMPK